MELGSYVTSGERLFLKFGDNVPILGVDEHENARILRELQHLEEVVVLGVERSAFVGHEDLDGRDALLSQARKLGLYVVAQVGDRDVETVVYYRLAASLLRPGVEGSGERATLFLEGEVDDHGRPARGRRFRAGRPVVGRHGPPERHVHVRVGIYKARHHELAARVYILGPGGLQVRTDGDYFPVLHQHVRRITAFGGHDRSTAEK